ncbi:Flp pilus assembly protein TadB [Micromonospora sp. Llam0]|uniref:type II secretion system F family protein n=1 Tax=Micromonospora sp. Llam0 TaxID=2485143 RepID=UPI000F4A710B|nr:type II secretion system F family protein [Micromonospora sp. Llam0]ROO60371.1 Flp pilus assembly protein TadB [Micromonospora sp. Llam0]
MTGVNILCGLAVGLGVWLVATGARRVERPDRAGGPPRLREFITDRNRYRLAAAVAVGVLVAGFTRWPVAALLAAMFTYAAPSMLGGGRAEAASLAKLEAIASWTEALRGSLRSYAGIEQAIRDTADLAKPPIHAQSTALAAALDAGVRLPAAMTGFKRDVDHHAADLVATALRKASGSHTGNLAAQLGWLAHAVRERVAAVQRVETARTEAKASARLVIIIVVVVGVGLYLFNRPLLAPFDSPTGQVVLLIVGAIWTLAAVWLQRLTRIPQATRVLRDDPETGTA